MSITTKQVKPIEVALKLSTSLTIPCELTDSPEEFRNEILTNLTGLKHGLSEPACYGAGVEFDYSDNTELEAFALEIIAANLPHDVHVFGFGGRIFAAEDVDKFAKQLVDEDYARVAQTIRENGVTIQDVQEKYGQVDELRTEPIQDPYQDVALTAEEDPYRHWPTNIGEYQRFVPDSTDHPPILPYGNAEWDTTILCMTPEFSNSDSWKVIQVADNPNNLVGNGAISDNYESVESYTVPNELAAIVALSAIAEQRDDLEELLLQALAGINLLPDEIGGEVLAASISPSCSEEMMVVVRDIIALETGDDYRIGVCDGEILAIDDVDCFVRDHVDDMRHESAVYDIVESTVNRKEAMESMRGMLGGSTHV